MKWTSEGVSDLRSVNLSSLSVFRWFIGAVNRCHLRWQTIRKLCCLKNLLTSSLDNCILAILRSRFRHRSYSRLVEPVYYSSSYVICMINNWERENQSLRISWNNPNYRASVSKQPGPDSKFIFHWISRCKIEEMIFPTSERRGIVSIFLHLLPEGSLWLTAYLSQVKRVRVLPIT